MNDIVEFALTTITDYVGFEGLATEVMREEGYSDIIPLGGIGDYGQDATVEKIYHNSTEKTVFQYTVDKNTIKKLDNTASKLKENRIDYQNLIYVTSTIVQSHMQEDLKAKFRKEYKKNLMFFERKTFVKVLSDAKNNIFNRYFQNIEQQIKGFRANFSDIEKEDASLIEVELLKLSLSYVYSQEADKVRGRIYDNLVMAVLNAAYPKEINVDEIYTSIVQIVPDKAYIKDKLSASLDRLEKAKRIAHSANKFRSEDKARQQLEIKSNVLLEKFGVLVDDIVKLAEDNHPGAIDDDTRRRARRNICKALVSFFKAFGTEITSQYASNTKSYPVFKNSAKLIADDCSYQIGDKLGGLLFYSIGEVLAAPSDDQIDVIHGLVLANVTNALMVLDPNLKEFQSTRFCNKTFILDTDFLINCIIPDLDTFQLSTQLLKDLLALRATVVIPDSSIDEAVLHAKYSIRTYNYFGSGLLGLPETVAREKINNAFVRGYYLARTNGRISSASTFPDYLLNYFDIKKPIAFMREVLKTYIPDGVSYKELSEIIVDDVSEDEYQKVFETMLKLTSGSKKAEYRGGEENKAYAEVDTALFLATYHRNSIATKDTILGGSHYIITDSGRYRAASFELDYKDTISTRPQSLISILATLGISSVSKADIVKTLENPILMRAVEEQWDDIGKLIKLNFDLSGLTLPRLLVMMEDSLHASLTNISAAIEADDSKEFNDFLKKATQAGLSLPPAQKAFETELASKDDKIKELEASLAAQKDLELEIEKFGKRRQKYLRRHASTSK